MKTIHETIVGTQPSARNTFAMRKLLAALVLAGGVIALLALVGCGSSAPGIEQPTPIGGGHQSSYAYLYSLVDYPLQIPVNKGDTVTLTLSPHAKLLEVTPTAGAGSTTIGQPIPLPTDVTLYQDIGAEVDTTESGNAPSPVVWQLTSPLRQSLLEPGPPGSARKYQDAVNFTWHVQAVAAGQNLTEITLHLYYIYLNGQEKDGSVQVSQAPIPIVAVTPTVANTTLPALKLPIAGLSGLAGLFAVLRFLWKAYQTFNDVAEPAQQAVQVAGKVRARMSGGNSSSVNDDASQPQADRRKQRQPERYPNPWQQAERPPVQANWPSQQGPNSQQGEIQGQGRRSNGPLMPPMPPPPNRGGDNRPQ